MAFGRIFPGRPQWEDANGNPLVSGRLFFYAAGTSTKQNTYNSSMGTTPNSNPMVLNSLGQPNNEIWGDTSHTFKIGLAAPGSDDPPASFIWTEDDIPTAVSTGGGGGGSAATEEWVSFSGAPTFTSVNTFTVTGDQTGTLHIGRRIKATVTAGTVYGTITNSVFGSVTTLTLSMDSTNLDSGLSAFRYGLLSAVNTSRPQLIDTIDYRVGSSDRTKRIRDEVDALTAATTRARYHVDEDVTVGTTWALNNVRFTATVSANALTFTLLTKAGNTPSATDPIHMLFRSATASSGTYINAQITSAMTITVPSGAELGTVANVPARIYFLLAEEGSGTAFRPSVFQPVVTSGSSITHTALNEAALWNGSTIGVGSDSGGTIYGTSGVSNRPIRIIGYIEISQATPGTWASSPTVLSLHRDGAAKPGDVVQRNNVVFTSAQDIASVTPQDDTIPAVTEGAQVTTATILPMSATSLLRISAQAHGAVNATNSWTIHVHRDGATNAIAASNVDGASGEVHANEMDVFVNALSTASTTFALRAGPDGANTLTINGVGGTRIFGGVVNSFLRLEEIWV